MEGGKTGWGKGCAIRDTVYAWKGDLGVNLDDFLRPFLKISYVLSNTYKEKEGNGIGIASSYKQVSFAAHLEY